ncbi:MAG: hypothetical protein JWN13_3458 [Betaproteobacteria bacterium]|jgi:hypothetical protein|nr:hypothetical protein [Betaproteobacteria bacterium]
MRWFIYHDLAEGWRWVAYDSANNVVAGSSSGFATRDECVSDAKLNGYEPSDEDSA